MSQNPNLEASKAPKLTQSTLMRKKKRPFIKNGQYSISKTVRNINKVLESFYDQQNIKKEDKESRQALSGTASKVMASIVIELAEEFSQRASELAVKVGKQTIGREEVITAFCLGYHGKMKAGVKEYIKAKFNQMGK